MLAMIASMARTVARRVGDVVTVFFDDGVVARRSRDEGEVARQSRDEGESARQSGDEGVVLVEAWAVADPLSRW